jgi:undecaprenyl-diphosphatase
MRGVWPFSPANSGLPRSSIAWKYVARNRLARVVDFQSNRRVSNWTIILLGIIEGVTEFLPVSSTGHLLLAERWLNLTIQPSELFNVVIQSGAVLAVLLVFWDRIRQMARDWRQPEVRSYCLKLLVAFFITAVGGLVLTKRGLEMPKTAAPVAWATLIGGLIILLTEWVKRQKQGVVDVGWPVAIAVGAAQLVAIAFPGTSRSGVAIIVALILGLSRPAATEFSFLLGVPTLLAASGYKVLSALRHPGDPHEPWVQVGLGTLVAGITAFLVVRWLLRYVQTHTFVVFGWYRIAMGGVILAVLIFNS